MIRGRVTMSTETAASGNTRCGRGSRPHRRVRRRSGRESDRVMVPLRPGNTGGGKDPDFWRAFDGGEDEVIGFGLQTPPVAKVGLEPRRMARGWRLRFPSRDSPRRTARPYGWPERIRARVASAKV